MHLYYCILAYNEPQLLARSVNQLSIYGKTSFIIHVQRSVNISVFKDLLIKENVFFIPDEERIETIWGDISCVKASVLMFEYAIKKTEKDDNAYCILMSGSDYPVKNKTYIFNFFCKKYPIDFYSFSEEALLNIPYRKVLRANIYNWWFSFYNTKLKIEVKPFCFIRPRCFKEGININLKLLLELMRSCPVWLQKFFISKTRLNIMKHIKWGGSETWLQLTMASVRKYLLFINSNTWFYDIGQYIHNPEEILVQSVLNTILPTSSLRENTLVNCSARAHLNGSLNIRDDDFEFIRTVIRDEQSLFCRKFSSKQKKLLDFIDSEIARNTSGSI